MRTRSVVAGLLGLASLSACNRAEDDQVLELQWERGQRWHLGTTYRIAESKTDVNVVEIDGQPTPVFDDLWSDEVVWTYEVVETDLEPRKGDELYPYAVTPRGEVKALTVIRATLDPTLNAEDEVLLESDPVVYLVFRQQRGRLAAVISYTNVDGERVEQAWSSKELEKSWSPLSQSMLTAAPTYLAPHGVRIENKDRKLENGAVMGQNKVDAGTVDVTFDDELGGGVVATRYERKAPWPTWTVSENVEVRLLDDAEVSDRMRAAPMLPPPPEDYDYRAALAASLDIEAALRLSDEALGGAESASFGAPEGYRPWNGSWWPMRKGSLVFGYTSRDTLSDRLKADIDPVRLELDAINESLHGLTQGSSDYNAKVSEYWAKRSELEGKIDAFYDGVLADLDGGRLTLQSGRLTHADGWSYALDDLSPMDKVALSMYFAGDTYPNPFSMQSWEILNHYAPGGGSWWGHCNGWAAAAILNFEPTESVASTIDGHPVNFTTADIKGLLSEVNYSTYSRFYGARYYKQGDDVADLHPQAFHKIISFYLRDQQVPLVFDTTATEEVWNFPAYAADLRVTETTPSDLKDRVNVNTADFDTLDGLPGIGEVLAQRIIDYRTDNGAFQNVDELDAVEGIGPATLEDLRPLVTVDPIERTFEVSATVYFATDGVSEDHVDAGDPGRDGFTETYDYTLVTDEAGLVLKGTWKDETKHPDFAWVPYSNPTTRPYSSSRASENPVLYPDAITRALGRDFLRK